MPAPITLEVCVDSVQSALVAQEAGAQRVELCANLLEGGTTPSAGMMQLCRQHLQIGLHILIRPRRGDFLYTPLELEVIKQDIAQAKDMGANGVVLGVLQANGTIHLPIMRELVELARPMSVTFHRAFDLTPDPFGALEDLIQLGVERILTSGQEVSAPSGSVLLSQLVRQAAGRIIILPGGGITENNIQQLREETGAKEFHGSARELIDSKMEFRRENLPMGGTPLETEYGHLVASAERIQNMLAAVHGL